jgi:hypothetical protein
MADNFNLRSFLVENKLTKNAKLVNESQDIEEGSYSDSYNSPASKQVYRQLTSIVNIFKKSAQEEAQELDAAIAAAEQETGTEVTPVERGVLHKQLRWIRTYDMQMERESVENEEPVMEASYKAPSNSKEAQHLRKGDITGSGDEVVSVSAGAKTPAGKVEVTLKTKSGDTKTSLWGKTTKIGLKKVEESKLTAKEQALVEMVQNALGMTPQAVAEEAPIAEEVPMAEDEMVQEKSLPKYKNIDELMSNIEHGTNEAAHKYKMERMKEVAEALEAKVTSLEEGENAEHIDQKAVKQMRKDIQALRKAEEKLRKEFEKKFASKKETKEDK